MTLLIWLLGFVILMTVAAAWIGLVILACPPKVAMSPAWVTAHRRAEMRAEVEVDHVLEQDGREIVRSQNEEAVEAVRATIEQARRLAQLRSAS